MGCSDKSNLDNSQFWISCGKKLATTACKNFAILSCSALVYTLVFNSQMSTKQKAAKAEEAEKSRHPLSSICYEKIEGQMDE